MRRAFGLMVIFNCFEHYEGRGRTFITHNMMFLFEYIKFSTKGRSDSYQGDIINSLSGLDLSGNQFEGKIQKKKKIW